MTETAEAEARPETETTVEQTRNEDGGLCTEAGAQTGGGPGVTLECVDADGELRWAPMETEVAEPASEATAGCSFFNFPPVEPPHEDASEAFTHAPFDQDAIAIVTNGEETGDPRFTYQWIKERGSKIAIYAPADGVFFRIRHKAFRPGVFESSDYDLFFAVSCDTMYRLNHITDPREDLLAAYQYGDEATQTFNDDGTITEHEDMQVPTDTISVKAGELIAHTSGTPTGNNFDFQVAVDNATVCPYSVFVEPLRTELMSLLGPQSASPAGPGQPGYECKGFGQAP